ncbi:hypothetical protein KC359_g110 [Hortaea werneckii]|nr:hypothetical protein KC359_g110 [Hortaea werneckii]
MSKSGSLVMGGGAMADAGAEGAWPFIDTLRAVNPNMGGCDGGGGGGGGSGGCCWRGCQWLPMLYTTCATTTTIKQDVDPINLQWCLRLIPKQLGCGRGQATFAILPRCNISGGTHFLHAIQCARGRTAECQCLDPDAISEI